MPRTQLLTLVAGAVFASAALGPSRVAVRADDDHNHKRTFSARLISFNEVPSISSPAQGTFRARLSPDGTSLHYKLTYSGLSAPVTQSHIHFGERHTSGGVMVWLCSGPTNVDPTGLAPTCVDEGSVEGDLTAANIVQPGAPPPSAGQGIAAGEFEEFVRALRGGSGYANVHSTLFPGGEIRGQVQ
jgi:CHRD domain